MARTTTPHPLPHRRRLRALPGDSAGLSHPLVARFKIMAKLDISERRKPRMEDQVPHARSTIELRSLLPRQRKRRCVMRSWRPPSHPSTKWYDQRNLDEMRKLLAKPTPRLVRGAHRIRQDHNAALGARTSTHDMKSGLPRPGGNHQAVYQVQVQPKIASFRSAMRPFCVPTYVIMSAKC